MRWWRRAGTPGRQPPPAAAFLEDIVRETAHVVASAMIRARGDATEALHLLDENSKDLGVVGPLTIAGVRDAIDSLATHLSEDIR